MSRSRICSVLEKAQKAVEPNGCDESSSEEDVDDDWLSTRDETEKAAMRELTARLPRLGALFTLHRKVGEGTFSCVYVGSLRGAARGSSRGRLFAMKHLVGGAHPLRVEHELRCLRDMGGRHHVVPLELCLRHLDTVVIVMPYVQHDKFSEYVGSMQPAEVCAYMRALLQALRHVHSFGVIHRDVKPSNFLYDRARKRYQLIDFGLAQTIAAAPGAGTTASQPLKRPHTEESVMPPPAVAAAGPVDTECLCTGRGGVCAGCGGRAVARAPRAGTQGFRPPEVLLKSERQTTAVDVWAAGVVLLSVLCARYPLLRAPDDCGALAELGTLLGTTALQKTATALKRRLIVSEWRPALCLHKLARRLRSPPVGCMSCGADGCSSCAPCKACGFSGCLCLTDQPPPANTCGFPSSAFSLCYALLQPDPAQRPSAAAALNLPFLATPPTTL